MAIRVLVVDDSFAVLQVIRRVLSDDGYSVTAATDGDSGLRILKSSRFDIVLSDYQMPDMKGNEFLSKVLGLFPSMPTVLVTGSADFRPIPSVAAVLRKPFSASELLTVVSSVAPK